MLVQFCRAAAGYVAYVLCCFVTLVSYAAGDSVTVAVNGRSYVTGYNCSQTVSDTSAASASCFFSQGRANIDVRASASVRQLGGDLSVYASAFDSPFPANGSASAQAQGGGTYVFSGTGTSANLGLLGIAGFGNRASCSATFLLDGRTARLRSCGDSLYNAYQVQFGTPYQISFEAISYVVVANDGKRGIFGFSLNLPDGVTATPVPESDTFILLMVGLLPIGFRSLRGACAGIG